MAAGKQPAQEDSQDGAPEWMLTFSDCMTLLLTFFVLLLSFSSFDENVFRKLTTSIADALPSVGLSRKQKDAFLPPNMIRYNQQIEQGSEKPTTEAGIESSMKETPDLSEFRKKKRFISESTDIFWGDGRVLSLKGRIMMGIVADFLRQMPHNVMVCERPAAGGADDNDSGLNRAWAVVDYLCSKCDFEYDRFTISAAGTYSAEESEPFDSDRILEIVLLEEGLGS